MNSKGLHASIFRWHHGECSRGGISATAHNVTILSDDPDAPGQIFEPDADAPAVRLVRRAVWWDEPEYVHAEPVEKRQGCGPMHGGTFIYSCDARFYELTGTRYPVALHDRYETV